MGFKAFRWVWIGLLFSLLHSADIWAQRPGAVRPPGYFLHQYPTLTFKIQPLALVDPISPGLQGAIEFALSDDRRWSGQIEGAYLFDYFQQLPYADERLRGLRLRYELRRYLPPTTPAYMYFGLQFTFKNHNRTRVSQFCGNNCNFTQNVRYTAQVFSYNIQLTGAYLIETANPHLRVEIGAGAGVGLVQYSSRDLPIDLQPTQFGFFANTIDERVLARENLFIPVATTFLRIGWDRGQ